MNTQTPKHTEYVEPLPEKLIDQTFGNDCVCIFPDNPDGRPTSSLIRQPHFDKEQRLKNEAICAELVRRYNSFNPLAKALQDMVEFAEIIQRHTEHTCHGLANAKQVLKDAGLTDK